MIDEQTLEQALIKWYTDEARGTHLDLNDLPSLVKRIEAHYASVQPPTREQIGTAVGAVLFNVSNYPEAAQSRLWGRDIGPLREKVTDAALALCPHPTPSAEQIEREAADVQFENMYPDTPKPVSIADMALGTTFAGKFIPGGELRYFQRVSGAYPVRSLTSRTGYRIADIVPSTIRDVTPPPHV